MACRKALPALADYSEFVQGIPKNTPNKEGEDFKAELNPYWTLFPELQDCKFFLGIGDGACANIGSKCTTASRIAVTIGTSAAARICLRYESCLSASSFFQIPKLQGLFCYRIDNSHVLIGGALTDGGSAVEWARQFLNLHSDCAFMDCMDQVQALVNEEYKAAATSDNEHLSKSKGAQELVVAPFLSGERSTGFRDGATGAVLGLTRGTTSAEFFKSVLEGCALRLKAVLDLIIASRYEQASFVTPVIIASGKAMENNDLWRQMIADSSGLRVIFDKDTEEATIRGAAQLVAFALQATKISSSSSPDVQTFILSSQEEEIHPFKTSEPRLAATAFYREKALAQNAFISAIAPLFSITSLSGGRIDQLSNNKNK